MRPVRGHYQEGHLRYEHQCRTSVTTPHPVPTFTELLGAEASLYMAGVGESPMSWQVPRCHRARKGCKTQGYYLENLNPDLRRQGPKVSSMRLQTLLLKTELLNS